MSDLSRVLEPSLPDLTECEREPIQAPGGIEPHGCLLVVSHSDLLILQASASALPLLGFAPSALLGKHLGTVLPKDEVERLTSGEFTQDRHRYAGGLRVLTNQTIFDCLVHRFQNLLIIELEPNSIPSTAYADSEIFSSLTEAMAELDGRSQLSELCRRVASCVRRLTGFDRVMVYRFLQDDSGSVLAEDRREDLIPYLGLRFPASDIPAQARRLYLINTLRLKPDVNALCAPLLPAVNPLTGSGLDMTFCILRAMSPVHNEYLRNMGVTASMSISIVKDGRLWGLIACHHTQPKLVPHPMRITCEVLARVFSSHIAAAEDEDKRIHAADMRGLIHRIGTVLRGGRDVGTTFAAEGEQLRTALKAEGAAFWVNGKLTLFGLTPTREQVEALRAWLGGYQQEHLFATERLADHYDGGHRCGILSARIALGGSEFLIWFRPAIVREINWGGNPNKPVEETEAGKRISPRRSFELWMQTVEDRSEPWDDTDREFAVALRALVAESLLIDMNGEVRRLNYELARSNVELDAFAYSASHDLKEPIRAIQVYAQLLGLRANLFLDADSRQLITTIENSAARMGHLTTALLNYSQIGGAEQRESKPVNLVEVLNLALSNLDDSMRESGAVVTRDGLPIVKGDPDHLLQLLQNLIGNSLKYRKPDEPLRVHLSVSAQPTHWLLCVRDNGRGFAPEYAEVIFRAFKRLHGQEVSGSGIGLATCRRVVEHQGGRIWAESPGEGLGSTFWFTLPRADSESAG